jgi:hypothetical protein
MVDQKDNMVTFQVDNDRSEKLSKIDPIHLNTAINYGLELLFASNLYKSFFKPKDLILLSDPITPESNLTNDSGINGLESIDNPKDLDVSTSTQEAPKDTNPAPEKKKISVGFSNGNF